MTYLAGYNSVLDVDDAVITSIGAKDSLGLAKALESGGCRPQTLELEYLLATARGEATGVRLVRKRGRPKAGHATIFDADPAWLEDGLPPHVRSELIAMLRSGAVAIRSRKHSGAGAGPRRSVICPLAAAGADIHDLALKLAKEAHPDVKWKYDFQVEPVPEEFLSQAKEEWIKSRLGRDPEFETEVNTWNRKVRRALKAYDDFPARFAK